MNSNENMTKDVNWRGLGFSGFVKAMYRNHNASVAALILRIALALVFITEGWAKITNISGTEHFFLMIGLTSHLWVYLVGYVEFIGALLLIVGFLTKPVSVALAIDMVIVVWGLPNPRGGLFWGHAYEFYLLLSLLAMYALGPGKYSLAYLLKRIQKDK
jgi:putative oxidoreductase